MTLADRHAAARTSLDACGQAHLLTFYDALDDTQKDALLSDIEGVDWDEAARLVASHVVQRPTFEAPGDLQPPEIYPAADGGVQQDALDDAQAQRYGEARAEGERLLRAGAVGVFCVAGGQGTRLGFDGPKGCYPATPIREASLFQTFAEQILKAGDKYGKRPPLYLMTSDVNDAATRAFFTEHDHFGLDPADVTIFPQAMMPAFDAETGKALLAEKHRLALSPNGHGGSLKALHTSGALADMAARGVEHLAYIQVDNPMVKALDPLFLGLHAQDGSEMSSKALPKRDPLEKLGNFCIADGKLTIIEYSNLPEALARETKPDGSLRFLFGSPAMHLIATNFVRRLNEGEGGFALPWNRADKKVPHVDLTSGEPVKPDAPNAVKLETFVFDAIPLCTNAIILETSRAEEFGPIKNAPEPGLEDSPLTSRQLQSDRAHAWLNAAGIATPAGATLELTHRSAIDREDVAGLEIDQPVEDGAVI